jgi:hypothetical protein
LHGRRTRVQRLFWRWALWKRWSVCDSCVTCSWICQRGDRSPDCTFLFSLFYPVSKLTILYRASISRTRRWVSCTSYHVNTFFLNPESETLCRTVLSSLETSCPKPRLIHTLTHVYLHRPSWYVLTTSQYGNLAVRVTHGNKSSPGSVS